MKVVILGSTHHRLHFGCQMTDKVLTDELEKRDVEILWKVPKGHIWNPNVLEDADLVIVNGEGSIHHGNHEELLRVSKEYPSILINATLQDLRNEQGLRDFISIHVRESFTQSYLYHNYGVPSEICPDLTFARCEEIRAIDRGDPKGRFLSDSAAGIGPRISKRVREADYPTTLARSKAACLGRFHAITVAMMARVPFSAFRSNTWKNMGIMEDAGIGHLYRPEYEDALDVIPEKSYKTDWYVAQAQVTIGKLFDRIAG